MAKTTVKVTGEVKLSYDAKSKDFKNALKSYIQTIDRLGNVNEMLMHIAFHVIRFGPDCMVEGVGYVSHKFREITEEPRSGVTLENEIDDFEFEIE